MPSSGLGHTEEPKVCVPWALLPALLMTYPESPFGAVVEPRLAGMGRSPVPKSPGHLLWGRTQTQGCGRTEMAMLGLAVETSNLHVFGPLAPLPGISCKVKALYLKCSAVSRTVVVKHE